MNGINPKYSIADRIRIYLLYAELIVKSNAQYRFNTLTIAIAVLCREAVNILIIYFLFLKFYSLQGWTMQELFFLYSFLFLSYSLVTFFFTGIRDFETMVYKGEFDRLLTRPIGPLFQVIAGKSDYAATIGHGIIGIILFVMSARAVHIEWNFWKLVYLFGVIAGGVLIQTSLFLISSSFSFWTIKTTNIRNIVFFNSRRFAGYPISIYPGFIQVIIIYVIPFAFVNYFPARYFLNKPDGFTSNNFFFYLTPIVGFILLIIAGIVWSRGVRNYSSVGN